MYIQNIPPVLSTSSFHSLIRQDISLNSITDGRVRRRQIQLTNAMTSILLMSLDSRSRHRANPENVMIPSSLTRSLVSHRTGDLFDVMNRNGWLVDHSYSPPMAGGKSFCKSLHIPMEAYENHSLRWDHVLETIARFSRFLVALCRNTNNVAWQTG